MHLRRSVVGLLAPLLLGGAALAGESSVEIRFPSGAIQLAATLTLPAAGSGRSPGIVLVGGSGPATRQMTSAFADHLRALGFATLAYDKRGAGQSQGSWTSASLEELADDAAAAIGALAARPEVDPGRVGVWAVSQGGWVVPLLAERTPRPAFAIVLTGGGTRPREVEMAGYRATLQHIGASPAACAAAEALLARYFAWLATGDGRDALDRSMAEVAAEGWFKALGLARVMPSAAARPKWEWVATHDPVPAIAKIRFPTLVILGASDRLAPASPAAQRWREGFERGGFGEYRIDIVADMGHAARMGDAHSPHDAPIAPRYLEIVASWLAAIKAPREIQRSSDLRW